MPNNFSPLFLPTAQQARKKTPLRMRLADLISGGKVQEISKRNESLTQAIRPGIPSFDFAPQYSNRTWLGWCYFFEHEVSILSDIASKIRDEVLRKGLAWKPNFVKKCVDCETEYDEQLTECKNCGSTNLRDPDFTQLHWAKRVNDVEYIEVANQNMQSMIDVLKMCLYHVLIADNMYLLCTKKYIVDESGNIQKSIPHEFFCLDPRDVIIMFDPMDGTLGQYKTCLNHREEMYDLQETKCKKCGKTLYPIYYQVQSASKEMVHYIKDEICHSSFYYPNLLYGFPKPLKMADELWSYHYIEKRVRSYYEYARTTGLLFIPTENQDALMEAWTKIVEQVKEDPFSIPAIGTSEKAPTNANFIKLLEDPNEQLIAIKDELRDRIASGFGVTMTFVNDTTGNANMKVDMSTQGMSDRTIAGFQQMLDTKTLAWITKQFGITDFSLTCIPHINESEMEQEELFSIQVNNARNMEEMGYKSEFHEKDNRKWFSYREMTPAEKDARLREQYGGMPGGMDGQNEEMSGNEETDPNQDQSQTEESPEDAEQGQEGDSEGAATAFLTDLFGKIKAIEKRACPAGEHSHNSYGSGKCHPSRQAHGRGGVTPLPQSPRQKATEKPEVTRTRHNVKTPAVSHRQPTGNASPKSKVKAELHEKTGVPIPDRMKTRQPESGKAFRPEAQSVVTGAATWMTGTVDKNEMDLIMRGKSLIGNPRYNEIFGITAENLVSAILMGYQAHANKNDVRDFEDHFNIDVKLCTHDSFSIRPDSWSRKLQDEAMDKPWLFLAVKPTETGIELYEYVAGEDFYNRKDASAHLEIPISECTLLGHIDEHYRFKSAIGSFRMLDGDRQ